MSSFDQFAHNYRAIHNENVGRFGFDSLYFIRLRLQWLQRYESNQPLRLLDVGCGDGLSAQHMQLQFNNWQLEAIDISAESVALAQQKNIPHTRVVLYEGKTFPYADNSFDVVYIGVVLLHIPPLQRPGFFNEIYRVLKPGGRLYVFEHNPYNPATKYLVKHCVFDTEAYLLTAAATRKLCSTGFLQVTHTRYMVFIPAIGFLKKWLRCEKFFARLPLGGQYLIRAVKPETTAP
jgi:ubiquinone/menaquinone biosynthesis C-methylase UbiE